MRKSFDGLFELVGRCLQEDPLSGDLFIFINRRSNYLKGLLWDRTGIQRYRSGSFSFRDLGGQIDFPTRLIKMGYVMNFKKELPVERLGALFGSLQRHSKRESLERDIVSPEAQAGVWLNQLLTR